MSIDGSTFSGNNAGFNGGGADFNMGINDAIDITNSTFSGNNANNIGGGINIAGGPNATISHVTITDNSATLGGGGIASDSINTNLDNTLVAGNTAPVAPDVSGTFTSGGWNLIGINTAAGFGAVGDQLGSAILPIDPHLGPLADNGGPVVGGIGPTRTHRLKANSPAIDTGDPAPHAIHLALTVDQRNAPRDARHDIGAYEAGPSIHGVKFIDDNWDGFQQDDELGLEGLTVELVDAGGDVVAITHTDKHGEYWFDLDHLDLPYPATYEIRENTSDIWYLNEQTAPAPFYYGTEQIGGGALVGVDFDELEDLAVPGVGVGVAPTNWTQLLAPDLPPFGVGGPIVANDLMDENGNPTPFDISVNGDFGDLGGINTGPIDANTLPVHTTSLAGLDGAFFDQGDDVFLSIDFSDLNPFYTYEVYVFAYGNIDQNVTITGDGLTAFTQTTADGDDLAVNDDLGSSGRSLKSYAVTLTASATGSIDIDVLNAGGLAVAGVAIQEIGFNASNLYHINDTGPEAGKVNLIGATNVSDVDPLAGTAIDGLALVNSGRLFGTNSVTNELYELSRVDGDATLIGPVAIDGPGGQAYDIVGGLAHNNATDTTYALARNQLVSETSSPAVAIPANVITDPINAITIAGVSGTVADLNVTLNITHPDVSQLEISLRAPDGTLIDLVEDGDASGANFTGTNFDDEALEDYTAGTAPYTGTFRPDEPLSAFDGLTLNGDWELVISNGADVGTLIDWTLDFTTQGAGLLLLSVNRDTGVGTPVGTGALGVFGDISALGFDGGFVHFYDNTFNNFHTANPTTGVISAGTPANPAGLNTSAMTYNSRLDALVVHDGDNPDQLLQFTPPGGVGASVLTMNDPLNLAALEYSPYDLSYTIDLALGDHVYGLDFGNEITPDDLEDNNSIGDATDLGTVVHTEIEHLSLAADAGMMTNDIEYIGDSDNNPANGISLEDLVTVPGAAIRIGDKLFDRWMVNQNPDLLDLDEIDILGINDDPFNPGLSYETPELSALPGEILALDWTYFVSTISGLPTLSDASVELMTFVVGDGGMISIAENIVPGGSMGILALPGSNMGDPGTFDSIDPLPGGPYNELEVTKSVAVEGGEPGEAVFLDNFKQNFSMVPADKIPDWDYFKVTSWATGSFDFTLDQQAGYLAAEVINGAGEVVASVDATEVLFEDDFEPTDLPGWSTTQSGIPLADDWFLTTQRGNDGGHSAENSYKIGPEGIVQLGFGLDGSSSVGAADWTTLINGLATALNVVPTNSTVEVTVVEFSDGASTIVTPTLIDSPATLAAVSNIITARHSRAVERPWLPGSIY